MAVDCGVATGFLIAAGGTALGVAGASAGIAAHRKISEYRRELRETRHRRRAAEARVDAMMREESGTPRLPRPTTTMLSNQGPAVWEFHGKNWVLRIGAAVMLTLSATQLQAMELKPAAQLIHQQFAEQHPEADVSFNYCKMAAAALGAQGGLKNKVEIIDPDL